MIDKLLNYIQVQYVRKHSFNAARTADQFVGQMGQISKIPFLLHKHMDVIQKHMTIIPQTRLKQLFKYNTITNIKFHFQLLYSL